METNKPAKSERTTQAQIQTELMRVWGADGETLGTQGKQERTNLKPKWWQIFSEKVISLWTSHTAVTLIAKTPDQQVEKLNQTKSEVIPREATMAQTLFFEATIRSVNVCAVFYFECAPWCETTKLTFLWTKGSVCSLRIICMKESNFTVCFFVFF